jgi:orotate phosphoribosyltransferase
VSRVAIDRERLERSRRAVLAGLQQHALVVKEVVLASGQKAPYYVDVRRAALRPELFLALGELIAWQALELQATAVGGVPLGAIPLACAALGATAAGLVPNGIEKGFFLRKERKGYGLGRLLEGPPLGEADRAILVEDVVTTGGSTVEALSRLAEEGVEVVGVVAVLDRLAGGEEAIGRATAAPYRPLFTIDQVYPDRPDRKR